MPPKKENGKSELETTSAEEIFNKPPAPAGPLPKAWVDDSIARMAADEVIAEKLVEEFHRILNPPPKKARPQPVKTAPQPNKKSRAEQVVDAAMARIVSAKQILATEYPEQRWAVKNVIPEGTTFIAGPPKLGKSIFSLNIALAVAEGGKALSYFDVERGAVLYLALEDSERRIQKRLRQLVTREPSDNLEVVTKWPRLNMGGIEAIEEWTRRKRDDARLLIVDTFKMLRPLRLGNNNHANTYDIDYEDVSPLTEFTIENHIALLIVTHTRKLFADDPLATVSGSFGLTGAADGVLVLSRQRNNKKATLTVIGRDVEEQELALEFSPDIFSWAVIGDSRSVKRNDEREEILALLKDSAEPMPPRDIADLLGRPAGTIRMRLLRMRRDGELAIFDDGYQLPDYAP